MILLRDSPVIKTAPGHAKTGGRTPLFAFAA